MKETGLIEGKKLKCGHTCRYSEKYDAYYCRECNKWLEQKCSDIKCEFCAKRTNNPGSVSNT